MRKLTIDDVNLSGKRVLVRVDFNVPLRQNKQGDWIVADDTRIRAALPTLLKIIDAGGVAILMSHLGRPKSETDLTFSLKPVADALRNLLEAKVLFVNQLIGLAVEQAIQAAEPGSVILLENTRFHEGEKKNDAGLAKELARLGDLYVNDAFGSAHRAHASTDGIAHQIDHAVLGYLMQKEVVNLSHLLEAPEHPFVAILGGAKVSDKIGVIEALLEKVDTLLIGGAMSYTFLKALGHEVGTSLVEDDKLEVALRLVERYTSRIKLPVDHVVAQAFSNEADRKQVVDNIPEGYMGLDIGPKTVHAYRESLLQARTVIWNGPMGVFEMSNFAQGTFAIAKALADATDTGAFTVVGGGDSVAAIVQSGYDARVSHVSTGGGAMLEFLEGKTLPGVAALSDYADYASTSHS